MNGSLGRYFSSELLNERRERNEREGERKKKERQSQTAITIVRQRTESVLLGNMFHQREQQRFPPIAKPQRFKLLQDVTQQPYRVGNLRTNEANAQSIAFCRLDWHGSVLSCRNEEDPNH